MSTRLSWFALPMLMMLVAPCFAQGRTLRMVIIPGEDRFSPFTLQIHTTDSVEWVNNDTDDHTVVSNDAFNTAGHQGFNEILPGTDSNGGQPGTLTLHFPHAGTFAYYCRFHAMLDAENQPKAPGPKGGIQDPDGNFGTPMMGEITVLPRGFGGGNDQGNDNQGGD
jgi:plastocyanin